MALPKWTPDLKHIAPGGLLIRRARLRAGLSQTELAQRLKTSQSLIARWERGLVDPSYSTVVRAVRACGFDLHVEIVNYDFDHDRLISQNLRLPPKERLRKMQHSFRQLDRFRGALSTSEDSGGR